MILVRPRSSLVTLNARLACRVQRGELVRGRTCVAGWRRREKAEQEGQGCEFSRPRCALLPNRFVEQLICTGTALWGPGQQCWMCRAACVAPIDGSVAILVLVAWPFFPQFDGCVEKGKFVSHAAELGCHNGRPSLPSRACPPPEKSAGDTSRAYIRPQSLSWRSLCDRYDFAHLALLLSFRKRVRTASKTPPPPRGGIDPSSLQKSPRLADAASAAAAAAAPVKARLSGLRTPDALPPPGASLSVSSLSIDSITSSDPVLLVPLLMMLRFASPRNRGHRLPFPPR